MLNIDLFLEASFFIFSHHYSQILFHWLCNSVALSLIPDLDFSFIEMNPFTLVNGEPYPLDMRGELDDTATFKNFKKYVILTSFPHVEVPILASFFLSLGRVWKQCVYFQIY